jgi:hypothetical protein
MQGHAPPIHLQARNVVVLLEELASLPGARLHLPPRRYVPGARLKTAEDVARSMAIFVVK